MAKIQANGFLFRISKLLPDYVFIFAYKINQMDVTITTPVSFTEGAIKEVRKLMAKEDFDATQSLRVGVKGGGCSGMTYIMGFDHQEENDQVFEIESIRCIMNKAHEMYLFGMEIDWQEGLNNRGFTFKNPNASTTCGCGTSFGV